MMQLLWYYAYNPFGLTNLDSSLTKVSYSDFTPILEVFLISIKAPGRDVLKIISIMTFVADVGVYL
jgi:hypothetical protein